MLHHLYDGGFHSCWPSLGPPPASSTCTWLSFPPLNSPCLLLWNPLSSDLHLQVSPLCWLFPLKENVHISSSSYPSVFPVASASTTRGPLKSDGYSPETLIIRCGLHYSAETILSKVSNHPLKKLNGCSSATLCLTNAALSPPI